MSRTAKNIARVIVFVVVTIVIIIAVIVGYIYFRFRPFHTDEVRKWYSETALAHSKYYHVVEDESRARDSVIYLTIKEIPEKTFSYECTTSFGIRQCHLSDNLAYYYFFKKHSDKVESLMEKHQLNSESHALKYRRISDVEKFAQDLLEIPDFRRLYQAFLAECERTSVEQANEAFDWYFLLDINTNDYSSTRGLFTWMMEQKYR